MEMQRCENCLYWLKEANGRLVADCRVNPPEIGKNGVGVWPTTSPAGWCAAWKRRLGMATRGEDRDLVAPRNVPPNDGTG